MARGGHAHGDGYVLIAVLFLCLALAGEPSRITFIHPKSPYVLTTLAMKQHVFAAYGIPWSQHGRFEVDHLVPRELGGADDVRNLWPQPWTGPWNAHLKDRLENQLHKDVCSGKTPLVDAQQRIARDWITTYRETITGYRGEGS